MKTNQPITVSIVCVTYNHAPYIRECLDGFLMQQCTFNYEIIIHDDASTDGTTDIIREYIARYPDRFVPILQKENQYSKGVQIGNTYIYPRVRGKYIAECEGDDYWTDPMKLQKQVDFLEGHPDYSMCFHAADVKIEGVDIKHKGAHCEVIEDRDYTSTEMFSCWIVPTASIVYNRSKYITFQIKHSEWLTRGDIATVLTCAQVGKVRGMSDKMSVYRMQPNSVSHNPAIRGKEIYRLANHFRCLYINFPKLEKESITWCISNAYYGRMKASKRNLFQRLGDFILFFYWNPRYAIQKILSLFQTKILRK